jgi:light-regulated signal transduction histidine kinase (bacteriophytochrome)
MPSPPEAALEAVLNAVLNEMQQFLQSAVHDLRASQRRTGISAELLLQSSTEQDRMELAAQLQQGLAQTEELLSGISRYANAFPPSGYSMTVFDAASAVRFAVANLDRQIRETGATIAVGDLPEVFGDRDRIVELFEYLIGNSLKFHGSNSPAIEIAASRVSEGWQFSITDNGIGIPAKYRDRLFIPFRRLHGPEMPGTGLGLATSKKIVEAHRGRIWIEDQASPGVTICFVLPPGYGD